MKQVWKCDFCSEHSSDPEITKAHELKCGFNPINKTCWTCKFHKTGGHEWMTECTHKDISHSKYFDINDDNLICDKWEAE